MKTIIELTHEGTESNLTLAHAITGMAKRIAQGWDTGLLKDEDGNSIGMYRVMDEGDDTRQCENCGNDYEGVLL